MSGYSEKNIKSKLISTPSNPVDKKVLKPMIESDTISNDTHWSDWHSELERKAL